MSYDVREKVAETPLRCRACDVDLANDGHWKDANGYRYCDACVANLRGQQPHQVPLFKCDVCSRAWPLRALTERSKQLICKECLAGSASKSVAVPVNDNRNPQGNGHPASRESPPTARIAAPSSRVSPVVGSTPVKVNGHAITPAATTKAARSLPAGLVASVTCPHCWTVFAPDRILWVSQHAELIGDPILGPETASRFRPTRFNAKAEAIDARGMPCQVLACPHCHLIVPPALIETPPLFCSIIGAPACGKSHFLASMVWNLRRVMATQFNIVFNDADPAFNQSINRYEELLFLQDDTHRPVAINKTAMQGELYDQVRRGDQIITFPKPFLFTLRPMPKPRQPASWKVRMMCFYDNAGEHYQPGMDTASSPATQHLARARVLFFLYDPSQHPRFREACRAVSSDPQLNVAARSYRQEQIITEAATRVRRYAGLSADKKHDRPLMVLVSKADIWGKLLGEDLSVEPLTPSNNDPRQLEVDLPRIERVSRSLRALLMKHSPEFVAAAEDFCQRVLYVPISSLGTAPELDSSGGMLGIRPDKIKPQWVTAPVLYLLAKWSTGLLAAAGKNENKPSVAAKPSVTTSVPVNGKLPSVVERSRALTS